MLTLAQKEKPTLQIQCQQLSMTDALEKRGNYQKQKTSKTQ